MTKAKVSGHHTMKNNESTNPHLEAACSKFRQFLTSFATFTDGEWLALSQHGRFLDVRKYGAFVQLEEVAQTLGFVLDGSLRQYYVTSDGDERTTYFFFENALVGGYVSLVGKKPSPVCIEAMEDALMLVFPYVVLETLYDRFAAWERFGRRLGEYLVIGLEERLVEHLMYSPEERYQRLLRSHRTKILERVPQQYIASYLGITPVSLSRIRARGLA
jgi:CRP-like cAMP-binding protein